jgi:choline dehydrogenase
MRSGIASSELCARLEIPCVLDLPGVGENLIEHPTVMLWMVPKPGVCKSGEPYHQVLARCSSGQADTSDLYLFMLSSMATGKLPLLRDLLRCELAGAISVMLCQPESRGRVAIQSLDPGRPPVIDLNLLSTASDVERLACGVRTAWKIARAPVISSLVDSVFMWNEAMLANDELLKRAVSRFVNGSWHAVGTARMGDAHDCTAVVDQRCRVHGIAELRVVDASVMPNIPSVPTSLTCIALAERVADWMKGQAS